MSTPPPSDNTPYVPPPPPAPIPAYNPYAMPSQPYPAMPPYPQPSPRGQDPWAPPPTERRSVAGLVTGIVAAGVVVVGTFLTWASNTFPDHGGSSSPIGEAPKQSAYTLSVPDTLVDGRYSISQDISSVMQDKFDSMPRLGELTASGGVYVPSEGEQSDVVTYWGVTGPVGNPVLFRGNIFGYQSLTGGQGVVGPEDLTPSGTHLSVSCEVVKATGNGTDFSLPMCIWDDASGAIAVSRTTPEIARQDPAAVNLQSLADLAGKVVDEVRSPLVERGLAGTVRLPASGAFRPQWLSAGAPNGMVSQDASRQSMG